MRKVLIFFLIFKAINSAVFNRYYEGFKAPCCSTECCCSTCSVEDCQKSMNQQQLLPMNIEKDTNAILQSLYSK